MPRMGTKPSTGIATYFGILAALAGAVGAVYAAIKNNDTAAVTAGVGTIATILSTQGGRYAQAVMLAKHVAPYVQAGAAGLSDPTEPEDERSREFADSAQTNPWEDAAPAEAGDVLDGAPDIATHPPDAVGADEGDPLTRGEVTA